MKILYILNSGNPGGMEQHVLDLVTCMVARDHVVYVWCPKGEMSDLYERAGARVTNAEITFDIDPNYIYSLFKFLREEKVDVVHGHELKAVTNTILAGFFAKTPVRIGHTHTPISEWQINPIKKKLTLLGYAPLINLFATNEIALTESRKRVKMDEGIKEGKLNIIPNGIDTNLFNFSPKFKEESRADILARYSIPRDAFVFGYVSRMTEEKGHSILVEAFSQFLVRSQGKGVDVSKVYLLLIGGGKLEGELRAQIATLGLNDRVLVTGVFSPEDKFPFYASLDAFAFPSLAEGFGIALIEAMASRLSVICSDLPVLQEVGGSTVMYFEGDNATDLAEKLYDLYTRFDQFDVLRSSARDRVEELYSMNAFATKYEDLYRDLLEGVNLG